jgi:hypothetical protein
MKYSYISAELLLFLNKLLYIKDKIMSKYQSDANAPSEPTCTSLLVPTSRVLQVVKKFHASVGTQRFIHMFTRD